MSPVRPARAASQPRSTHPPDGVRLGAARAPRSPSSSSGPATTPQGPVDAHGPHHDLLPRVRVCAARARRAAAPDPLQPAGGARGGGLLHPGPRRARRRSARRGDGRGERARRDAAPSAAGRARGDDAPAEGDGGDRRRGVHVRRGTRAQVRQPRRGAAPEPAVGAAARTPRRGARPRGLPGRRGAARHQHRVPRRRRPLGNPPQPVPPGRTPPRAARALRSRASRFAKKNGRRGSG